MLPSFLPSCDDKSKLQNKVRRGGGRGRERKKLEKKEKEKKRRKEERGRELITLQ